MSSSDDEYISSSDDDDVSNRVYHTAGNDGKQRVETDYSDIYAAINKANEQLKAHESKMSDAARRRSRAEQETMRDIGVLYKKKLKESRKRDWEKNWGAFKTRWQKALMSNEMCPHILTFIEELSEMVKKGQCGFNNCIAEIKLMLDRFETGDLSDVSNTYCVSAKNVLNNLLAKFGGRKEEEPLELKF